MKKIFSLILLVLIVGIGALWLQLTKKHQDTTLDTHPELTTATPTPLDVSRGATITVSAPSDIPQWVGEVIDMIVIRNFAYVSTVNHGMQVLDLTDPTNPQAVASIHFSTQISKSYRPSSFFSTGEHLYVGAGCTGGMLFILDLVSPTQPMLLDAHYLTCSGRIYISNNKAYIANNYSGLLILDVSDPRDVKEYGSVGVLDLVSISVGYRQSIPPVTSLAVYEDAAWVTVNGFEPTVLKLDTTNLSKMIVVAKEQGRINYQYSFRPYMQHNNMLYTSSTEGIYRRKIELNSSTIEFLTFSEYFPTKLTLTPNLFVTQNRLYLVSPEIGLYIFDSSDNSNAELIGRYQPASETLRQVYVSNDEIALVAGDNTLQILNVRSGSQITPLFFIP